MKIIPVALTGAFVLIFAAGTFENPAFSLSGYSCGPAKPTTPNPPYAFQQTCCTQEYDDNGNLIKQKCEIHKCYYGYNFYFGGKCDIYIPGGKETAATTGNLTISNPMKNETNELKQLIPTEPGSGNPSTESNQPKQLVPLTPPNDTVSDDKKSTDTDQLKQLLPTEPEPDNPATEKGNSEDKGTDSK